MIANGTEDFDGDDVKVEGDGYTFDELPPIEIDQGTGCWIPRKRSRTTKGYVTATIGKHTVRLHRFVFSLVNGRLRPDEVVRHTCDRRDCCNPAHLLKGSHADNIADRVARGRSATGERHGAAKFTNAKAVEIYLDKQTSPQEKAAANNVAVLTITRIMNGQTYKQATAPFREGTTTRMVDPPTQPQ